MNKFSIGWAVVDRPLTKHQIAHYKKMDQPYIDSGIWKCPDSPTGAHQLLVKGLTGVCQICGHKRSYKRERKRRPEELE